VEIELAATWYVPSDKLTLLNKKFIMTHTHKKHRENSREKKFEFD
jgi:hypothetical protein